MLELRAACYTEVNKLLFEFVGPATLNTTTEDQLLGHIKAISVKVVHKEVHRMSFGKMAQSEGESITHYVARLRSQATLCQFTVNCPCNPAVSVSYADEMVSQQMIIGLRNQDHQSRILSEVVTLLTLDAKINRIQALETTEESALLLHKPSSHNSLAAAQSQYKRTQSKGNQKSNNENNKRKCRGCGRHAHPDGKPIRRENCPAYDKTCNNCKIKGHFANVCEKAERINARAALTTGDSEIPQNGLEAMQPMESNSSATFAFSQQDFRRGGPPIGKT